jgi:phenylalanyl-tRNA synthetase beta chain
MAAVWSAPSQGLLRDAVLFDVYRPQAGKAATGGLAEGEKSLAVRLTLNSDEATLTEAQIDAVMAAQLAQLSAQLNARLRA